MADEQKTNPDRTTYTSLNLGRESVDRHPSQQPETLYSSPAQRAALLRTCGGAAILLGIVISLVASAAMVATAPPPVGTVRFGLPQPQAKRSVAGRLRQRLVVDVGTDNFELLQGATVLRPGADVTRGAGRHVDRGCTKQARARGPGRRAHDRLASTQYDVTARARLARVAPRKTTFLR